MIHGLLHSTKPEHDAVPYASKSDIPHELVVVYNSNKKDWDLQHYRQEEHETFGSASPASALGSCQIVFIRGFLSPSWASAIGSKYIIDPEFFRRHMHFLTANVDKHAYGFPSLPSSSNNIFRLCVNTILHRDDFGGQDLQTQRSNQARELKLYKLRELGSTRVCSGDSIVREYSTLCSSYSVMEQWISIYIANTARGWTGKCQFKNSRAKYSLTCMFSDCLDGSRQAIRKVFSGTMGEPHGSQGHATAHTSISSKDGISNHNQPP